MSDTLYMASAVESDGEESSENVPGVNFKNAATRESDEENDQCNFKGAATLETNEEEDPSNIKGKGTLESDNEGLPENLKTIATIEDEQDENVSNEKEKDPNQQDTNCKDINFRVIDTVEDNTDPNTGNALCSSCDDNKASISRLRNSETLDETEHGKNAVHYAKELSFHDDVFVPPSSAINKGGVSRKSIDSLREEKTVETVDDYPYSPLASTQALHSQMAPKPTRILMKVIRVRKSEHNENCPTKGLLTEPLTKGEGEVLVFGRGLNVDVYLQDLLASKQHMKMKVKLLPLQITITNISETKSIILNDSQKLQPEQSVDIRTNDMITIGCLTFLIELVEGDISCTRYQLQFYNLVNEQPVQSPYLRTNSLAGIPPAMSPRFGSGLTRSPFPAGASVSHGYRPVHMAQGSYVGNQYMVPLSGNVPPMPGGYLPMQLMPNMYYQNSNMPTHMPPQNAMYLGSLDYINSGLVGQMQNTHLTNTQGYPSNNQQYHLTNTQGYPSNNQQYPPSHYQLQGHHRGLHRSSPVQHDETQKGTQESELK